MMGPATAAEDRCFSRQVCLGLEQELQLRPRQCWGKGGFVSHLSMNRTVKLKMNGSWLVSHILSSGSGKETTPL